MSLYEQLGGESKLRAIIDDFIDRVFDDTMIGFFFAKVDRAHIKTKEFEFAAQHLGAPLQYSGRTLPAAHSPHKIMGGHFMRRLQLLKDTLLAHEAPSAVVEHWLAHNESMRGAITADAGGECVDSVVDRQAAEAGQVAPSDAASASSKKPLPSVAEINAFLAKSSANTKRRLTLAGSGGASPGGTLTKAGTSQVRGLPVVKKK